MVKQPATNSKSHPNIFLESFCMNRFLQFECCAEPALAGLGGERGQVRAGGLQHFGQLGSVHATGAYKNTNLQARSGIYNLICPSFGPNVRNVRSMSAYCSQEHFLLTFMQGYIFCKNYGGKWRRGKMKNEAARKKKKRKKGESDFFFF